MNGFKAVSAKSVEWGKEIRWGVVKRRALVYNSTRGMQLPYAVTESGAAAFAGANCIAVNLTHDEASALCAIMNAGEQK